MSTVSLDTLPREILYQIFNLLDEVTVFRSLYDTSVALRNAVSAFDFYKIDFSSMSKNDFTLICQRVRPTNIISLTLYDGNKTPGQVELFLSLFRMDVFTRLRSLTVRYMYASTLNRILEQTVNCPLETFSVKTREENIPDSTLALFEDFIARDKLIKLDLSIRYIFIEKIVWPNECLIRHLTIGSCTLEKYKALLRHSPLLKTFICKDISMRDLDNTYTPDIPTTYTQLTSLSLIKMCRSMNEIQSILSLTPSLTYLKLINDANQASKTLFNGAMWEWFIKTKLPQLEKFEFFFSDGQIRTSTQIAIDSLISEFETCFWTDDKRWFVLCDYIQQAARLNLYTLPMCETFMSFDPYSKSISRTTSFLAAADEGLMDNVRTTRIKFNTPTTNNEVIEHRRLFRQVKELRLIGKSYPSDIDEHLSMLIDLSRIATMILDIDVDYLSVQSTLKDIKKLFDQAQNLRSLKFSSPSLTNHYEKTLENICSIVPRHVTHLQISVKTVDHMITVFEMLNHLSSVSFSLNPSNLQIKQSLFQWLTNSGRDFTARSYMYYLQLWLRV